jgi:DNA replication protein DnaC
MSSLQKDFQCRRCEDTGMIHPLGGDGSPEYGESIPCPECQQDLIERQKNLKLVQSGIPRPHLIDRFETFKLSKGTEEAFDNAFALADKTADFSILILGGPYGCGKTHLLYATAHAFFDKGKDIKVCTVADMLGQMRMEMSRHDGSPDLVLSRYKTASFTGLDDLGWHYDNPRDSYSWSEQQIQELINHRYAHELPTVITINCTVEDFCDSLERLKSRFLDATVCRYCKIDAPDFRPLKVRKFGKNQP